jgi:uncharacterized RDD family membrane protein YckC
MHRCEFEYPKEISMRSYNPVVKGHSGQIKKAVQLLLGVLALTFLVPYLILGAVASFTPPGWGLWLHVFVVLGVYFVWYWRRGGQTLAMQTWRLKIVDGADGRTASLGRCWLRYALAWPSVLLCGFGLLWALVDRDRQFLHDRLAGTCIVLLPVPPKS